MPRLAIVYDSPAEQGGYLPQVVDMLYRVPGAEVFTVTSEGIMGGVLNGFDAVVFPGGIASWTGLRKWGVDFAHAVRYFVAAGGGYLGVCGGAYIAGKEPPAIINLLCNRTLMLADIWTAPPPLISTFQEYREMQWQRFPVTVTITREAHPIIRGHEGEVVDIAYSGGAILVNPGEQVIPLAFFEDGRLAIIQTTFGQGRVVLCSPHPEAPWEGDVGEPCVPWLYPAMAQWVAEPALSPDYSPLQPWERPAVIASAIPIFLGTAAAVGTGVVVLGGMMVGPRKNA